MKTIKVFILSLLLCNTGHASNYPKTLKSIEPIELGQIILMLSKFDGDRVRWDYKVNDKHIIWITDGVEYSGSETLRKGVSRINVLGRYATVLHQKKEALGWQVTLKTNNNPNFGPTYILVAPGLESEDGCFGVIYENCAFKLEPSFNSLNIKYKIVCSNMLDSTNFDKVYSIKLKNGKNVLITYSQSSGSGGTSNAIKIWFTTNQNSVCKAE
jgi:hypothetical protein